MTNTFQKPTAAIYPEVFCAASLRDGVLPIEETGQVELPNPVLGQTFRSHACSPSRHSLIEVFSELSVRPELPALRPDYACEVGHAALHQCGRTIQ
jgi:hypothetical protein